MFDDVLYLFHVSVNSFLLSMTFQFSFLFNVPLFLFKIFAPLVATLLPCLWPPSLFAPLLYSSPRFTFQPCSFVETVHIYFLTYTPAGTHTFFTLTLLFSLALYFFGIAAASLANYRGMV